MTKLSRDPHSVTALEQVLLEADDLNRKGNVQSAIQSYRDALGRTGNLPPFSECGSGWILISMATLERQSGRLESAEALLNRAMTLAEAEEDPVALLTVTLELAATLTTKGDMPGALAILERAQLPPFGSNPDLDFAMTVELYKAKLLIESGETEKALGFLRPLPPICIGAGPSGLAKLATITSLQALAHKEDGNYTYAIELYEEALQITAQHYGPGHADCAADLAQISFCQIMLGKPRDAVATFKRAQRIAAHHVTKPEDAAARGIYLAQLLMLNGEIDAAASCLDTINEELEQLVAQHPLRSQADMLKTVLAGQDHIDVEGIADDELSRLF